MEISGWVGSYAVGKSHQSDPEEQGLVDSRITNSGSMAISAAYSWRPSIWSTSVCAATCPILRSGCRTVVNPGLVNAAPGISSKPTTEISCGTRSEEHTSELQSRLQLVWRSPL